MNVLVTGGTGCLGHYVLSVLIKGEGKLISLSLDKPKPYRMLKDVIYTQGDLKDFKSLQQLLAKYKPTHIYHLASQNPFNDSQSQSFQILQNNVLGTLNLFEAVRSVIPKARITLASSAEVYGAGKGIVDIVHPETDPTLPFTPYASSLTSCEFLAGQYVRAHHLDIVIVRPFHYSGPLQSRRYTLPSVAAQIARTEMNEGETFIFTGNLDVSRDYVDVRDLARGICMLAKRGTAGEVYNLCSGKAKTIRDMVEFLINLSNFPIEVRIDPAQERENEIPLLVGSPVKVSTLTGWKPIISIEDSLKDLYKEMKSRVRNVPEEED